MAIYRALNTLTGVARRGELTRLEHLKPEQIAKLERVGAVSRIAAPPLAELPNWRIRAGKLAKIGVTDAEQYLEAAAADVSKALRVKPETEARYRQEIQAWLTINPNQEEQQS